MSLSNKPLELVYRTDSGELDLTWELRCVCVRPKSSEEI